MSGPMRPQELARYADAVVRAAVSVRPGDDLVVGAEPGHRPLAVALVEAAYRAGARYAEVRYVDPLVRAAQLRAAPDEWLGHVTPWHEKLLRERERASVAAVHILGETEPDAFREIDPARAASEATALARQLPWMRSRQRERRRRWAYVAWPTEPWAAQVYPASTPERAARRLARELLRFCRLGPEDPPGCAGLEEHLTAVQRRADRLTRLGLERLELRGPGIDLAVRLPAGTLFGGPRQRNAHGIEFASNVPTEEVFVSPDAPSTEGVFRCSRPLRLHGRLIEDLSGEFRHGRLVRLDAKRPSGDYVRAYLGSIRNADRLGEVALVDRSSRIGQTGRIYYNALIDENAVTHIAFGSGFDETRDPAVSRRGVNRSDAHVDVMIGTDDLEVTGRRPGGRRTLQLIRDGAWQV
jgi:aminopeptidase